ncbi:PEPxxWA-CTERM sorting domain-containing protein [Sphingobium sufflavum]|uniref:PEPxxWA-CTERM sorting domain-containing protein n=1 Tax=Sphingobium sufflavum TaxID=1129547 RepID=UPI001F34BB9F|nr:PEPxxWA-CTERM sorting domain-containing protein [Sphingobium sufflavum]MCE7797168.1 PEPxxWA-CTERM sorting domain-containing protein [Sphingobium sufflavum]
MPAHAAIIFTNVAMTAASAANTNVKNVVDTKSKSSTVKSKTLPATLSTTATATASGKIGVTAAIDSSSSTLTSVTFASPASGVFSASSNTGIVQAIGSTRTNPILSAAAAGAYTFTYNFGNIGKTLLTINYNLLDPNSVATSLSTISLTGGSGAFSQAVTPNASGSLTATLLGGNYQLRIGSTYMDRVQRNGLAAGTTTGSSFDIFSFSFAAVPEPATWMMLILGFGAIGTAMRRRRTTDRVSPISDMLAA